MNKMPWAYDHFQVLFKVVWFDIELTQSLLIKKRYLEKREGLFFIYISTSILGGYHLLSNFCQ